MNDLQKTSAFVAVALLLAGAAAVRMPGRTATEAVFADQGKPFFPDFRDPLAANSLEVYDYDPAVGGAVPFQVTLRDGKWVIPSHHDYPADAKDRLKNTAAGVMDLTKDAIRSTNSADHKPLGVLDPLDPKVAGSEGVGKRIKLSESNSSTQRVLADFIIGKEVPGHPEQRYVRVPDQKQTYAVNVKVDLSTRFSDWIETNLLKLDAARLRRLTFDNHKVDPEQLTIDRGDVFSVARKDAAAPWTMDPPPPAGEEVNAEKLTTLTTALADLKIAGVRPMPKGVEDVLRTLKEGGALARSRANLLSIQSLRSRGFIPTPEGIVSNQGDVRVATDEGVVYTLRFGEITFASGEELSAGKKEEKDAGKDRKDASEEKKAGGVESRYLMVTVDFDPALIPEPAPTPPAPPTALPEKVFQPDPGSPEAKEMEKSARERADREQAERDRKVADGKKRAKELSDRFLAWYYVVPGDNFRDIVLTRAALLRKISDKPATPPAPPSFPGLGGPGGLGGAMPGLPPDHP